MLRPILAGFLLCMATPYSTFHAANSGSQPDPGYGSEIPQLLGQTGISPDAISALQQLTFPDHDTAVLRDFDEGFTFTLCGLQYNSVWVNPNGAVEFGASTLDATPDPVEFLTGSPAIAGLWSDLDPSISGGAVYAGAVSANEFLVIYQGVRQKADPTLSNNFMIRLFSDGTSRIQYGSLNSPAGLVGRTLGGNPTAPGETKPITVSPTLAQEKNIYEFFEGTGGGEDLATALSDQMILFDAIQVDNLNTFVLGDPFQPDPSGSPDSWVVPVLVGTDSRSYDELNFTFEWNNACMQYEGYDPGDDLPGTADVAEFPGPASQNNSAEFNTNQTINVVTDTDPISGPNAQIQILKLKFTASDNCCIGWDDRTFAEAGTFNHPCYMSVDTEPVVVVGPTEIVFAPEPNESRCLGRGNNPPRCDMASASQPELWPPNHEMVPVTVHVSDPDGDPVTVTITGITQDEPVNGKGSGNTTPDAEGVGTASAQLRAERQGSGNGRVYEIFFEASDGELACEGSVFVCVPHDQRPVVGTWSDQAVEIPRDYRRSLESHCINDGQIYDSTKDVDRNHPSAAPIGVRAVPNPFNASTTIEYSTTHETLVSVVIYNVLGQRVRILLQAPQAAGTHGVLWNGRDDHGQLAPSGVYVYQVKVGKLEEIGRMLLMK